MNKPNMMSGNGNQRYDQWLAAWNERADEIDDNIVDWWQESWANTTDAVDTLQDRVANWWDRQHLDEKASAEWKKARADGKVLRAQLEQRVTHLVEDGKVKLAELRSRDNRG